MRIALVILAPATGGVSRHVFDLAEGLRAREHTVELFGHHDAVPVANAALARGLIWHPLSAAPRARADVWHLHLHNTLDRDALPLMLLRRGLARGRLILTEHLPRHYRTDFAVPENLPSSGRRTWRKPGAKHFKSAWKKLQYGLCDSVIAVSAASMQFIQARYGLTGPKLVTVFNGVPVTPQPPPPPPPDGSAPMRVLAIGDLHWRKGFDVLLEACELGREDWSLTIVGDGVARRELEASAARLGNQRKITLAGYRDDGASAPLEGDVVCVPSRAESFSYVVLEAMAAARPVVASAVDGTQDAIVHEQHGLLVAAEDPAALARALDTLAADAPWREQLGRAAFDRATERFTVDHMVEATLAVYART